MSYDNPRDRDFPFPRLARINLPHSFDPYVRSLNERFVLTENVARIIADAMAAEVIHRLKEDAKRKI